MQDQTPKSSWDVDFEIIEESSNNQRTQSSESNKKSLERERIFQIDDSMFDTDQFDEESSGLDTWGLKREILTKKISFH